MLRLPRIRPGDATAAAIALLALAALAVLPPPRVEASWNGLVRNDDPHRAGQARLGELFGATDGFVVIVSGEPPAARHAAEDIAAQIASWPEVRAVAGPRKGFEVPGAVSADGRHAAVYVEIRPRASMGPDARRLLERLPELERPEGVRVRAAGGLLEEVEIARAVEKDLLEIVPLVLLALALISWWLLRTAGAALSIFLTLGLVMALTLASVGLLYGVLTTITCLAVPIVVTIAAANAVHLTHRLRLDRAGRGLDEALRRTRTRGGRATALAAITTGIGFLALLVMNTPDFQHLAVLGAVGCTWTWVVVVGALPALLARLDRPGAKTPRALDVLVEAASRDLDGRGWAALALTVVLLGVGVGVLHLRSGTKGLEQIPADSPFHEVSRILDDELGGTLALEAIVEGPEDLRTDAGVERLRRVADRLRAAVPEATMVVSAVDLVDLARQKLPQAPAPLVFQAAASGRLGPLPHFLDGTGRAARFTIRLKTTTTGAVLRHAGEAERALRSVVKDGERFEVVGAYRLIAASVEAAVEGQALACLLSIVFVSLVAALALRAWRAVPVIWAANLLPLLALGGILGWIGQPISISTAVVGSVVFGLVVDDTLHYLYALREEKSTGPDAARRALVRLGPAFVATSVVLLTGALVTSLGRVPGSVVFARMLAVGVVLALLCVLFVAPRVAQRLSRRPGG